MATQHYCPIARHVNDSLSHFLLVHPGRSGPQELVLFWVRLGEGVYCLQHTGGANAILSGVEGLRIHPDA